MTSRVLRVALTEAEQTLFDQLVFDIGGLSGHDAVRQNGLIAQQLTRSLLERDAVPPHRLSYFTDSEYNIRGRGKSREAIFRSNSRGK